MANNDIIRAQVVSSNGTTVEVHGIDANFDGDRIAVGYANATCAEEAVQWVWDALNNGVSLWLGDCWAKLNPDHVIAVQCPPFD